MIKLNKKYYLSNIYVNLVVLNYVYGGVLYLVVLNYVYGGVLYMNYDFIFKLKYGYKISLNKMKKYLICG